jgi:NADP-dependent 3-hydroxy acid dehydrogenase YdfG
MLPSAACARIGSLYGRSGKGRVKARVEDDRAMGAFDGRAGVITGASSGIGRDVVRRFGCAGMELWLVGRSEDGLRETAAIVAGEGGPTAHCIPLDITRPGELAAAIAAVDHPNLSALVNSAGVMFPEPLLDADPARWRELFDVHVIAMLEASQAAVRRMRAHGNPSHIVNVSSLTARWDAGGAYGAAKLAVESLTRTLRKELERDAIRMSVVVPGGFRTNLARGYAEEELAMMAREIEKLGAPMEQILGDPDEVARIIEYIVAAPPEINLSEVVIRPPISLEFD